MKTKKQIKDEVEKFYKAVGEGKRHVPSQFQSGWESALEWIIGKAETNKIRKKYGFWTK